MRDLSVNLVAGKIVALRPLDFDDVCNNTEIMENKDFVIVREVFELTPKVRKRANEWIVWANDNPDRVKSILD